MGCENNCINEHRFEQIENDIRELREQNARDHNDIREKNSKDHKEFYNRIESTEKSMVESVSDRKHINAKLDKIDINVETLMQKPAKRYENVIISVLTALAGALVGFILNGVIPM